MKALFHSVFYEPLYNALIFVASVIPGNDAGVAIVLLTIIVRLILLPVSHKSVQTQKKMRDIEPEIGKLKEQKVSKEEQARLIMDLYKRHGVNPFSSFLLVLLQFPIIIALYLVFRDGLDILSPAIYSFTPLPAEVHNMMLGLIDITQPSPVLAVLAGISYYFQMKLALPSIPKTEGTGSFKDELSKSMAIQTKYILPVMIGGISLKMSAGLPLYWLTSSIFAIFHELYVKRSADKILATSNEGSKG